MPILPGRQRRAITSSDSDMRTLLHIVTRPDDALTAEIIAAQQKQPSLEVHVVDLTLPEPDYLKLLEDIFDADSVVVW